MAAALDIGPKLIKIMGFDLISHCQCIEFSMEKC
jgi:hypothetical protein